MAIKVQNVKRSHNRLRSEGGGWDMNTFFELRDQIRHDLMALRQHADDKQVAEHLEQKIAAHHNEVDAADQMKTYIYGMNLLIHWERTQPPRTSNIRKVEDLILGILAVALISPDLKKYAFLFGDLYLVISQIHRRIGNPWRASWFHIRGERLTKQSAAHRQGFLNYGRALTKIRLGSLHAAMADLSSIVANPESSGFHNRALLQMAKVARLMGDYQQAQQHLENLSSKPDIGQLSAEVEWEKLCIKVAVDPEDILLMVSVARRSESFKSKEFELESQLYAFAGPRQKRIDRLRKMRTFQADQEHGKSNCKMLMSSVRTLHECYDTTVALEIRLDKIGSFIDQFETFLLLEHELLAIAAFARFLVRSKAVDLAQMLLDRYQEKNLALSNHNNPDVFGVLSDLLGNGDLKTLVNKSA